MAKGSTRIRYLNDPRFDYMREVRRPAPIARVERNPFCLPDPDKHPTWFMINVVLSIPFVLIGHAFYAIRHPIQFMDCGGWGDNRLNDPMWSLPPSAYERAGYMPPAPGRHRGTDSDGSAAS